ncbi:GNAT family N-acetyltransferase [Patulibacter americanus]|uniref:GNAT family N-acetyltransferase n=1 Tax=Patulibacter americanus TaxID=588672 RepID=UPI0003B4D06E|nr:GNAT family N-acetyltransferase [Patulibacter americanus]
MPAEISLVPVDRENVRPVCDLVLAPGQETFVAPAATTVAEAAYEPDAWLRAIALDGVPVGVVLLVRDAPDEPYFLVRLMVDAAYQRRGIGAQAVALTLAHLRGLSGEDRLRTSCIPGEGSPLPFYRGLGFTETGEVDDDGERVLERGLEPDPRG